MVLKRFKPTTFKLVNVVVLNHPKYSPFCNSRKSHATQYLQLQGLSTFQNDSIFVLIPIILPILNRSIRMQNWIRKNLQFRTDPELEITKKDLEPK